VGEGKWSFLALKEKVWCPVYHLNSEARWWQHHAVGIGKLVRNEGLIDGDMFHAFQLEMTQSMLLGQHSNGSIC